MNSIMHQNIGQFIWSRVHSLLGLGIVLFLVEHFITNSQAALFPGEDGIGFIRMVNFLHALPYLKVLEVSLIGLPIVFHGVLGVRYALTGKMNVYSRRLTTPEMRFGRNYTYLWQRLTSWILLVGIILHVGWMRFAIYPIETKDNMARVYVTRLDMDKGIYRVCDRLGVKLMTQSMINAEKASLSGLSSKMPLVEQKLREIKQNRLESFDDEMASIYNSLERFEEKKEWVKALEERPLAGAQVLAVCPDFGTATLLNVRNTFKNIWASALYTIFVLAAVFHAFNGLWTFFMTWGLMIKTGTQFAMTRISIALMVIFAFLGLAAIWGTYWINLKS